MKFYENYLKKEEIIKRTKKYGFPQPWLIELLVYDFEIFRQLLKISKKFILKGGAAAQTYLPLNQQRASIDIDLITSLKPTEIEEIFMNKLNKLDFVNVKVHKPKKINNKLPLITYLVDLPSVIKKDETVQLKVDIMFEEIDSYKIENIGNKELFALKIDDHLPCIKLGSLIADKLLTLASRSVGIHESKQDQLPKHVYDLSRLIGLIKKEDFEDLLFSFEKIAKVEMNFREIEHKLEDIIEHINEILIEFVKVDIEDKRIKKLITNFQSAYVNKESRISLSNWAVDCLRLKYLTNIIKEVLINKKNKDKSYNKFVACEKEFKNIGEMEVKDKISFRENILNEAREKLPDWKSLKGKSEERIFLEIKQLDGQLVLTLIDKCALKILKKEKFDRITGLNEKDREKLKEVFKDFIENKRSKDELIVNIIKTLPYKKPYLCKFMANTETTKIYSLAKMAELKSKEEKLCYVYSDKKSELCSDCSRLIDGRVLKIMVLENNIYANYNTKNYNWKPTVPLHPNCNHQIRELTKEEKTKLSKDISDEGFKIKF